MKIMTYFLLGLMVNFGVMTAAKADADIDSGPLTECGAMNTLMGHIKSKLGNSEGAKVVKKVKQALNSKIGKAACFGAFTAISLKSLIDHIRIKVNTSKKHVHIKIKPIIGSTLNIKQGF